MKNHARVAALAAKRHRRHIRAVGFQHNALQRHSGGGLDRFACVRKRQNAAEADVHALFGQPHRVGRAARKAVYNALGAVLRQKCVSVGVGFAVMHQNGHAVLCGQRQMRLKHGKLCLFRHRPVVVQPALAHGNHVRIAQKRFQLRQLGAPIAAELRVGGGVFFNQAFRVDARRRVKPRVLTRQL